MSARTLVVASVVLLSSTCAGKKPPRLIRSTPGVEGFKGTPDPRVVEIRPIDLDIAVLKAPLFELHLDPDQPVTVKEHRRIPTRDGFVIVGRIPKGSAIFVVHGEKVAGCIETPEMVDEIRPSPSKGHLLVRRPWSREPPLHEPGFNDRRSGSRRPVAPLPERLTAVPPTVTVLAVATKEVGDSLDLIRMRVRCAIEQANLASEDSGVELRLELVDVVREETYDEDPSLAENLDRLIKPAHPKYLQLAAVRAKRVAEAADVALLLVGCPTCDVQGEAPVMAEKDTAFAVVVYRALPYFTLAHELGHLMGLRHEVDDDPKTDPYPYGHGYKWPNQWRTIMATPCFEVEACPRMLRWSSPKLWSTPDDADNARALDESHHVATFY